jgi:chemotaxis protein CheD
MCRRINVRISQYRLAEPPAVLVTYGLGSCLAIALHDPQLRIGGLAHTLLPSARQMPGANRPAKFVDAAVRMMREDLLARGAQSPRLTAKIFGGANMFQPLLGAAENGIGARNVRSARAVLGALEIPLLAEDVGGDFGRTVEFDPASGLVRVRAVRGREGEMTF